MSLGYTRLMRAAMIHEQLLEERRRMGLDKRDEVWAGVLHMVPPPASRHQLVSRDLLLVLLPIAKRLGLEACFEIGVFNPRVKRNDRDFRVPDLVLVSPHLLSKRGVEGKATLVVEILSPGDESRDKLPFYARMGVREVWLIDPDTRAIEVYALRDGKLSAVRVREGVLTSTVLGVELTNARGKLRIRDGERLEEV
jgi:Uma2 family endonuclease